MGLLFQKEPQTNFNQIEPKFLCLQCKGNKIEIKMYKVGIKLCRTCYTKKKGESLRRDLEYDGKGEINEITPKLYLGNNQGAKQKEALIQLGITHILVCGYYLHEYYPDDFTYKTVEIEDNVQENLLYHLLDCIDFINKATKVLVHCRAGISRSSSIVVGYLMLENKWAYIKARDFVMSKRDIINPNEKFEEQLFEFEDILKVCEFKPDIIHGFFENFKK